MPARFAGVTGKSSRQGVVGNAGNVGSLPGNVWGGAVLTLHVMSTTSRLQYHLDMASDICLLLAQRLWYANLIMRVHACQVRCGCWMLSTLLQKALPWEETLKP